MIDRIIRYIFAFVFSLGLMAAVPLADAKAEDKPPTKETAPEYKYKRKLKLLKPDELENLLNRRFRGRIGLMFGPFANMFMVESKIELDVSIGLCCDSNGMSKLQLEPAFPSTYRPTVREFLDALALETRSKWVYDEKYQFAVSTVPTKDGETELDGIVNFQFIPCETKPAFAMTPAKEWKVKNFTNWTMYIPPTAPMAMDTHVLGTLSSADKNAQAPLFESAPADLALDSLKHVNPKATQNDLKKTKVGPYDAYFFEHPLPPTGEEKIRWRQWHFMAGDRLCYVISTVPKELDSQLYPDIETMLKTFHPTANQPNQ